MGLGKPKLHTNFEVATSSIAEIIKGKPKFFRAPQPSQMLIFPLRVFYDVPWQIQAVHQI